MVKITGDFARDLRHVVLRGEARHAGDGWDQHDRAFSLRQLGQALDPHREVGPVHLGRLGAGAVVVADQSVISSEVEKSILS